MLSNTILLDHGWKAVIRTGVPAVGEPIVFGWVDPETGDQVQHPEAYKRQVSRGLRADRYVVR